MRFKASVLSGHFVGLYTTLMIGSLSLTLKNQSKSRQVTDSIVLDGKSCVGSLIWSGFSLFKTEEPNS